MRGGGFSGWKGRQEEGADVQVLAAALHPQVCRRVVVGLGLLGDGGLLAVVPD